MIRAGRVHAPALLLTLTASLFAAQGALAAPEGLRFEGVHLAGSLLRQAQPSFVAGETVVVRFELAGAGTTATGELALETGIRVEDAAGNVLADEPVAAGVRTPNLFAADRIPCYFSIPPQVLGGPGAYRLHLRAVDRSGEQPREARASLPLVVEPPRFHLGNRRLTLDAEGAYESLGPLRAGQTVFFCQHVVGYGLRGGQVALTLDVEVRARDGRVVGRKPGLCSLTGPVADRPPALLMAAFLNLTQAGQFEVRVTVRDQVLGVEETASYKITVLEGAGGE